MSEEQPSKAGRAEWLGLAVLALPTLLVAMDLTVLHLAVPTLTSDLSPSNAQLLWIIDIYGFLVAGLLIAMGSLGDRIGRRKLLLAGAAAFGAASVLAAFSTSAEMLIASRALLGVAGATLMPSTLSLIRTMFTDPTQRTAAVSVWASCFALGSMIGPLVGGALLNYFWWGSAFLVAVPVMVALLVLGPRLLPEHQERGGRVDLVSAALSLVAVLSVVYGLKQLAEDGFEVVPVAVLVVGLLVGGLFLRRQKLLTDPMLDLTLFRERNFGASLFLLTTVTVIMAGIQLFVLQYLQLVNGLSPLSAGLWSIPTSIGVMIGSIGGPSLISKVPVSRLLAGSMVILAVGCALLTQVDNASQLALVVTGSAVVGLGLGPMVALGTDLVVGAAPPDRAGSAAAVSETGTELGAALGIAVLGSIGFAVYRGALGDSEPSGLSADQADTASDTLGSAVALAENLPGALGGQLLDAARAAFIEGLQITSLVGGVLALVLAVVALAKLRGATVAPADGAPAAEPVAGAVPTPTESKAV
ncbi:MFS transporter [Streptomyces sp. Je 1-79]|uniref:MFS transporter n=1 Tax=Streptomyces sp. Je 1-79 TaxID=2943847 RepID=UPI0021A6DFF3|nr:MFS transporter [Streptomyces sp. Je 1-79]MCT4356202.1 MFS transporter [Streptomyces sp. Je 1-79]